MHKDTLIFIGLDTHKESTEVAYVDMERQGRLERPDNELIYHVKGWHYYRKKLSTWPGKLKSGYAEVMPV